MSARSAPPLADFEYPKKSILGYLALVGAGGVVSTAAGLVAEPYLVELLGYTPTPEELLEYYCYYNSWWYNEC